MDPMVQDSSSNAVPDNHCVLSACEDLPGSSNTQEPSIRETQLRKVCPRVEPVDASKSLPTHQGSVFDEGLPDTQFNPSATTTASNGFNYLDRLLPDTQRSSTSIEAMSESAIAVLLSDNFPPDTQINCADAFYQEDSLLALVPGSDSQLPDTQINEPQSIYCHETSGVRPDLFLQDTQVGTSQLKTHLLSPNLPLILHSQIKFSDHRDPLLPDTQCSIDSTDVTCWTANTLIQNDENLRDTQVSSGGTLGSSGNEDSLLPDTQSNTDDMTVTCSTTSTSIQHVRDDNELPVTQISLKGQAESSTSSQNLTAVTDAKFPSRQSSLAKEPLNKVTCRERKRIIVSSNRPPALTKAMCQWVDKTNYLLDPFREDDECWFHPSPPSAHLSMKGILRPCGKLQKRFNWKDRNGAHSLVLNYGIVSKLVNYNMTKQQKDGFINKQWHLSHLCGNWTCLNPAHTTVEPGKINISRNNCFSHRSGCFHNPPCMKDKKVSLGVDGKLVDHNASMSSDVDPSVFGGLDDWSIQGFDDGDTSTALDGFEDSESIADQHDDEDSLFFNGYDEDEQ